MSTIAYRPEGPVIVQLPVMIGMGCVVVGAATLQTADWIAPVERLGGWGALLVVVAWMMREWNVRMKENSAATKALADALTKNTEIVKTMAHRLEMLEEKVTRKRG